jgi:hypothetical protein
MAKQTKNLFMAKQTKELFGYKLKSAPVRGKINAQNAQAYFLVNNSSLLSGGVTYHTVTVILENVKVSNPPFEKPTLANFGQQSFPYEGKNWIVLEVTYGGTYTIGAEACYLTYTLLAVDSENPEFAIQ